MFLLLLLFVWSGACSVATELAEDYKLMAQQHISQRIRNVRKSIGAWVGVNQAFATNKPFQQMYPIVFMIALLEHDMASKEAETAERLVLLMADAIEQDIASGVMDMQTSKERFLALYPEVENEYDFDTLYQVMFDGREPYRPTNNKRSARI